MGVLRLKNLGMIGFILILLIVLLGGCVSKVDGSNQSDKNSPSSSSNSDTKIEGAFPVTVKDGSGAEVVIEKEPKTIVSLVPSNTEITFALGAGSKLIGVSDHDNYPEEVKKIEKVGTYDMNAEKILALNPDLALVTPSHLEKQGNVLELLEKAGTDVIIVNDAETFEDVYKTITLIAAVTGTQEKANEMISDMKQRIEDIKEKVTAVKTKKRVWVEITPSPDIFTPGSGTFINEMLETIQAINVAGNQEGWVKFTEEKIVDLNPEVIITTYGYYVDNPDQAILNRAGWAGVPAIKNKQVFDVNNDTVTRPGPRLIDGIEMIGKLVYPEIFAE